VEGEAPCPALGNCSSGAAPALPGAGGVEGGLALLRWSEDEASSRNSGSTPGRALGGCSTVELRTAPEPDRMAELGETLESIEEPGIVGTLAGGATVAPSVVTVAPDPQLVQGVVIARL
jgi:hypothetical protein